MAAEVELVRGEPVALVVVTGDVDLSSAADLRAACDAALADRPAVLVVDFTGVPFIDSTGLGALIAAARKADAHDGEVRIAGAVGMVTRLLQLAGVERVLPLYPTREAAMTTTAPTQQG